MSDFKIKMLQIRLRLWLRPRPKALPRPIAELRSQLLRGGGLAKEDRGQEVRGKGEKSSASHLVSKS